MITLGFEISLAKNPFGNNNVYVSYGPTPCGIFCDKHSKNYLYILRGEYPHAQSSSKVQELYYSSYRFQLGGRFLSTARVKEVLDSSRFPMIIPLKGICFLMGKGFMALLGPGGKISRILFAACTEGDGECTIEDVKFFVDGEVLYTDNFRPVRTALKDIVKFHPGDITVTRDVGKYVGDRIITPQFTNLRDLDTYKAMLIQKAARGYCTNNFV